MATEDQTSDQGVYYDADLGYFTSANAERKIAKLREKYGDWEITPVFTEITDREGQVTYAEPIVRFHIKKAIPGGLLDIRLLDTDGNETYRTVQRQQGFLQSPVVGILASAVIPGLGEFFAAQLAAAGAITGTTATTIGNALAKIAVDVATGKDLGDAVRDVALSTGISAGMPNLGPSIAELVDDPNIARVLINAGNAAVTAAVQGKDIGDVVTAAIAAGAGTAAAVEGGATAGRAVQSLIMSGGDPMAALTAVGSELAAQGGQAVREGIRNEGITRLPETPVAGAEPETAQPVAFGGGARIELAPETAEELERFLATGLENATVDVAALPAAAIPAAIARLTPAAAEYLAPAALRFAANNPQFIVALQQSSNPIAQRLLLMLGTAGAVTLPSSVSRSIDTGDETSRLLNRYPNLPNILRLPSNIELPSVSIGPDLQPVGGLDIDLSNLPVELPSIGGVEAGQQTAVVISSDNEFALVMSDNGTVSVVSNQTSQTFDPGAVVTVNRQNNTVVSTTGQVDPTIANANANATNLPPTQDSADAINNAVSDLATTQLVTSADVSSGGATSAVIDIIANTGATAESVSNVTNNVVEQVTQPAAAQQPQQSVVAQVNPANNTALVINPAGDTQIVTVQGTVNVGSTVNLSTNPQTGATVATAPAAQPAAGAVVVPGTAPQVSPGTAPQAAPVTAPGAATLPETAPVTAPAAMAAAAPAVRPAAAAEPAPTIPSRAQQTIALTPGEEEIIGDILRLIGEGQRGEEGEAGELIGEVGGLPTMAAQEPTPITEEQAARQTAETRRQQRGAPRGGAPSITPTFLTPRGPQALRGLGTQALQESLTSFRPAGEIRAGTGKPRKNVWNEASLRLKDALGL